MRLKKQTVSLAPTYTTVLETHDTRQDGGTDLGDVFNVHEDRWVAELYVITKAAVNPANEVFVYAELYEEMTREGIDNEDQLLARVPFRQSATDPSTAKLPPFIMRQDRNYRIDLRVMSATVDLNGAGLTPTYILEMLYDTKPIDFSLLPPYRCEVPIWVFEQSSTNNTGATANLGHDYIFQNIYEVLMMNAYGAGATTTRYYSMVKSTTNILRSISAAHLQILNGGSAAHKIDHNVRLHCADVPDTNTMRSYMSVQLVPVIP